MVAVDAVLLKTKMLDFGQNNPKTQSHDHGTLQMAHKCIHAAEYLKCIHMIMAG